MTKRKDFPLRRHPMVIQEQILEELRKISFLLWLSSTMAIAILAAILFYVLGTGLKCGP